LPACSLGCRRFDESGAMAEVAPRSCGGGSRFQFDHERKLR
jgi:hypothetical protein